MEKPLELFLRVFLIDHWILVQAIIEIVIGLDDILRSEIGRVGHQIK